ncbi:gliding motility-associated ABC transporter substrate-binding protein GldG [Lacibacter sediminis]|uniref:Gliding motility-associated ABC transporter substrate-binding protein GldG n=1 Tax=Lacibacter sediminis TaxID=2760713 RepID=A0A7G5XI44_9BACT|nr:gliding motility-associated ABC transporter substrate-binding protein GldG [Lacibacter sediminis]QNA45147.1 gliding motility-associated ABC transporter substrate-binding protein GldG [Lacibacter sediminis]
MKKLFSTKYGWFILLAALVLINVLSASLRLRWDLTSEERYSLSPQTKALLKNIDTTITVDVFLKGDFRSSFRKLRNSTNDLLNEMREYSGSRLQINYKSVDEMFTDEAKNFMLGEVINELRMNGVNVDSIKQTNPNFENEVIQQMMSDSLKSLGILPYTLEVQEKEEATTQRVIYPSALVKRGNKVISVDLLSGKTEYSRDPLTGSLVTDEAKSISNAEALLEFKFADAIEKIQRKQKPLIGYLTGNGQPMGPETFDLVQTLDANYLFQLVDLNKTNVIPKEFAAVMIVKPSIGFTDSTKMKIDQYIMQGGKVLWFLDMLHAEKDSLAIVAQTLAYDRGLNLDDLLFKYGVRINRDLLQDQQCDLSKLVVGNAGGQPQLADVPFNYYPLLNATGNHPITKNLEPVLSLFTNTLDTVKAEGITKNILLTSSENAKFVSTPAIISLQELQTIQDVNLYTKKNLPVAVFLEGQFNSFYGNRASAEMRQFFTKEYGSFKTKPDEPTQQLIIGDGDVVLNSFTKQEPFPMGYSRVQERSFANKTFLQNTLEYMTGNAGIVALRNKDVPLRLLNPQKVSDQRLQWQLINIAVPVLLVLLIGFGYMQWRKRTYSKKA